MMERTSFYYLVTMTNTQNEMVARQLEFAAYVKERLGALLGPSYLREEISYVSLTDVAEIDDRWKPFFQLFENLVVLHFEEESEEFNPRAVVPFGLIEGTLAAGPYIGAREIYDRVYLTPTRPAISSFLEYLHSIGFPIDKLTNTAIECDLTMTTRGEQE